MRMIIPYEKEIEFSTKIYEICNLSLEFESKLLDDSLVGEFILNGSYKILEVSVNKEEFIHRIPFSITLNDNIIKDSLRYDIYSFDYEIVDDDILKLNIKFLIEGDEREVEESVIEDDLDNKDIELPIIDEIIDKEVDDDNKLQRDIDIINNVNDSMNTYIIYHVYLVKDNDTIDSISEEFNVSKELISEYNNPLNIVKGEKLLIPEIHE